MERLAKKTVIRLFLQARRLGQHAQNRAVRRHISDIYSPEAPEMHHRQLTHAGQRLAVRLLTSISPDVAKVNCLACMKCQQLYLHTSSSHWASKAKNTKKKLVKPVKFSPKGIRQAGEVIPIRVNMTVQELADAMKKDVDHVFEVFLYVKNTDRYDQPDSEIDNLDVIKETLKKSGFRFKMEAKEKAPEKVNKDAFKRPPPDPSVLVKRPPVVTIMGHVDHGKTTLLDSLRHSNVVEHEFGGITQHIGAFSVKLPHGETITFLDTPGHAAFSAIRSRGAHVTDLIVLVVAVEDGVMQQTKESIDLAAECNVPVIVAINKIDKDESSLEAAKQSLMQHGVMLEEMGGDVQAIPISALKGTNLDLLQEAILAQAEMLEVRADPTGPVEGVVLESRMDPGRGKLSTALVQRGTLKKGVYLVAGTAWAKVRGMFNDQGKPVQEAGPSMPVEVLGWRQLPSAGDEILQLESEHHVREVIHWREAEQMLKKAEQDQVFIAQKVEEHEREYQQQLQERRERGIRRKLRATGPRQKEEVGGYEGPEVALVVKGDVDGSVEAILDTLDTYQSDQCRLHVLHYGVGPVSDHDVEMATLFNGVVYAFNVPTTAHAEKLANAAKVVVKRMNVIYRLVEDVKERLKEKLPPKEVEEIQGEANVLQPFTITEGKKKIPVAGCRCVKGALHKKKTFRLLRDGEVLFDGNVTSLKHFKNEVDSIKTDVECGISFADHSVVPQAGDIIVCYETKQEQQEIDWDFGF